MSIEKRTMAVLVLLVLLWLLFGTHAQAFRDCVEFWAALVELLKVMEIW